jgi:hypothetical protein
MEFIDLAKDMSGKKSNVHCLLVQPAYYSTYPPLGLLKISTLLKSQGYTTELVLQLEHPQKEPDIIFITSMFTYGWAKVKEATDFYRNLYPNKPIIIGGIYASLLPEHVQEVIKPDYIWQGVIPEAEEMCPDYSLIPDWNASIIFSSRGCIRRCPFCVVWKIEPEYKATDNIEHLIKPLYDKIIFWDNNFLASPYKFDILDYLITYRNEKGKKCEIDFNQGLDARLITVPIAEKIKQLKINLIRLAYDKSQDRNYLLSAIETLKAAGIRSKNILVYTIFNYKDTPDEFLERLNDVINWGAAAYPMRYQPNDALEKDKYIAPNWSPELLEMVAKARRVLGAHGAFPPYDGLIKKFGDAKNLEEAMSLRETSQKKVRLTING